MAAIAGVSKPGAEQLVNQMLDRMIYRGPEDALVMTKGSATCGIRWPTGQPDAETSFKDKGIAEDYVSSSHYASVFDDQESLVLTRDPLGVSPLYYGFSKDHTLFFASEVKGLLGLVDQVQELPPGSTLKNGTIASRSHLGVGQLVEEPRLSIAAELRRRLAAAVEKRATRGVAFGAWLSGGLDSSVMAALARPLIEKLHTFAAGFGGAADLEYARLVAKHIGSVHHEVIPTFKEIIKVIPQVIYHLESFDALLVRSSLMNYLVAGAAADYVPAVFSGEGGDELFAGYDYLKEIPLEDLPTELINITNQLHNTALQRVDRCSAAHGTVAYVGFLDPDVVEYAFQIPAEYKIYNGYEKWILRRAVYDLLPERVTMRKKAKFWEGAGVENQIASYADEKVSDDDFKQERVLPDGASLNTKEELYYYRVFKDHFGDLKDYSWMGRTKGSPVSSVQ